MTDVAGPPLAPVRFSSLPIRGADAARTDGADESDLEVNCSMAQAFEIPTGNGKRPGDVLLPGAILRVPRRAFQIAAPGRPDPISWIDQLAIWVQFWLAASAHKYLVRRDPRRADSEHGDLAEG
jgi:hypothetical protein